ncbi:MAG: hypothetical protein IJ242_07260, partial [Clostridia bacterium]|nr:hypothetical protein [Clostridia bacterium]
VLSMKKARTMSLWIGVKKLVMFVFFAKTMLNHDPNGIFFLRQIGILTPVFTGCSKKKWTYGG